MQQIDTEFKDIYQLIENLHNQTRKKIADAFNRASGVNDTGLREMSWWK
jgi:hypothetical protein